MGGAAGGIGCGPGGHIGGAGGGSYRSTWMADTKQTIEDELKSRGIEPQVPIGDDAMAVAQERKCNCVVHIAFTVLICTIIFMVVWELT